MQSQGQEKASMTQHVDYNRCNDYNLTLVNNLFLRNRATLIRDNEGKEGHHSLALSTMI